MARMLWSGSRLFWAGSGKLKSESAGARVGDARTASGIGARRPIVLAHLGSQSSEADA